MQLEYMVFLALLKLHATFHRMLWLNTFEYSSTGPHSSSQPRSL